MFRDANVLFSASYRPQKWQALWKRRAEFLTSECAVAEVRPHVDEPEHAANLGAIVRRVTIVPTPADRRLPVRLRDPGDRPILLAAIDAGASHLLTGDNPFAHLFGKRVEGVLILRPAAYLSEQ